MASPRSRASLSRPRSLVLAALAMALAGACAEAPAPQAAPRAVVVERPYLLPPGAGFAGPLPADLAASVDEIHRQLISRGADLEVEALAGALARERPEEAPVQVLMAQVELVSGDLDGAAERLGPVTDEWPDYGAAALLTGYLHERRGDLPAAFESYRQLAGSIPVAAERVGQIRPRALEIVSIRLQQALASGELERAGEQLARLESWAPGATPTLQGSRRLAAASGDARAELQAVRELRRRLPEDRELLDRLATLEVAVGDPGAGISILQQMVAERPDDAELATRLSRARFRWRLVLLPEQVRAATRSPEIDRSELAALLYWLFPSVRYARPQAARIVNDVFDHPFREEIVRVINLDVMEIDSGLHQFGPAEGVTRAEAVAAALRVVAAARPEAACIAPLADRARLSWPLACATGAACGLIDEEADCLPTATLSGSEAVELCRRAQGLLGGE